MVKVVLKSVPEQSKVVFEMPENAAFRQSVERELAKCAEKNGGYVLVTLERPRKTRTTGENSQNHHLNGHIMQICNETGNDFEAVKYCVKMIAVEQMGYPYKTVAGHILPQGERQSSTVECAKLIEAAHVLAADLGIVLQE